MGKQHSLIHKSLALCVSLTTALAPVIANAESLSRSVPKAGALQLSRGVMPASARVLPALTGRSVTAPALNALPVWKEGNTLINADRPVTLGNEMTVNQTADKAIIDWNTFNVGEQATVWFNQQGNRDWSVLNRVLDTSSPSKIFGTIKADGKVYLINRNGILFSPTARVNTHSLFASSLDITNDNFTNNVLNFARTQGGQTDTTVQEPVEEWNGGVSNEGVIATASGGVVYLIGTSVENSGAIGEDPTIQRQPTDPPLVPTGQIGLVAADEVTLKLEGDILTEQGRSTELPVRQYVVGGLVNPGTVTNFTSGTLATVAGTVGMYGKSVRNQGTIISETTATKQGLVELLASDLVALEKDSVIRMPISDSSQTVDDTLSAYSFTGGKLVVSGLAPAGAIPSDPALLDQRSVDVDLIEVDGKIDAPAGTVLMGAKSRVYLGSDSSIDVSGLWLENRPADVNQISFEFTSDNLKDEQIQKYGFLKGEKIYFDANLGCNIGDVSSYLAPLVTARERAVKGGTVSLYASDLANGDVTVQDGAFLGFAGGGSSFAAGSNKISYLKSGNKIYDIASAPRYLTYDAVVTRDISRPAHVEGADAGSLTIAARQFAVAGTLDGSVQRGVFQTMAADPLNDTGTRKARGRAEPRAGSVELGKKIDSVQIPSGMDFVTRAITVTSLLPQDLMADVSYISSEALNAAGLGDVRLYANDTVRIENDARLRVAPAGSVVVSGRRIEHDGTIEAAGGTVSLLNYDTITSLASDSRHTEITSGIVLGEGSSISVAGQKFDRTPLGKDASNPEARAPHLTGGTVTLKDNTLEGEGVELGAGSRVDVSGGILIDEQKKVTGGDAGSLTVQGSTIKLDGTLAGYALAGKKGGSITLHADEVAVVSDPAAVSGAAEEKLVLDDAAFAATGFSSITLKSGVGDLDVAGDAVLSPSRTRYRQPVPGGLGRLALIEAADNLVGATAVNLAAGIAFDWNDSEHKPTDLISTLTVQRNATVSAAPGGAVSLYGNTVDVAGTVSAPAGTITLSTPNLADSSILLRDTSRLLARGFNRPDLKIIAPGYPLGATPLNGGTIKVDGYAVAVEEGALLDVSGAAATTSYFKNSTWRVVAQTVAGSPGSVELKYRDNSGLETAVANPFAATFLAKGDDSVAGLAGGTFSLTRKLDDDNKVRSAEGMTLFDADLQKLVAAGFDDLTFAADHSIIFADAAGIAAGRRITLDTPEIVLGGADTVTLKAPWLRLMNSHIPSYRTESAGEGTLRLEGGDSGGFLDIDGDIVISGAALVDVAKIDDMRLFDRRYAGILEENDKIDWSGSLKTAGDLTLSAGRIYPAMHEEKTDNGGYVPTDFTITAGGNVTISRSERPVSGMIDSAGGSLTVEAGGSLLHDGTLLAPVGVITLRADADKEDDAVGRLYLTEESVTATRGEEKVRYGIYDGQFWDTVDKEVDNSAREDRIEVIDAPEKKIAMEATEVIVRPGALLDQAGGGELFAYQFMTGMEGSFNPIAPASGNLVILPSSLMSLPGRQIYLAENGAVPAGYYTIVPEQYAFHPSAYVVKSLGKPVASTDRLLSAEGYQVAGGYLTEAGTGVSSPQLTGYSVRKASDVLKEGNFIFPDSEPLVAGNGGTLSVTGDTVLLEGNLNTTPVDGYRGGGIDLSALNVAVRKAAEPLPASFNFQTPLDDTYQGWLYLTEDFINQGNFNSVKLGDVQTETVSIEDNSRLTAGSFSFEAKKQGGSSISVGQNAEIHASKELGDGTVAFVTPTSATDGGTTVIGAGATVKGDTEVTLRTGSLQNDGVIDADGGTLTYASEIITFNADGSIPSGPGIQLTDSGWKGKKSGETNPDGTVKAVVGTPETVVLEAREIAFAGDRNLSTAGDVVFDAERVTGADLDGSGAIVKVAARSVTLRGGGTSDSSGALDDTGGSLTVEADDIAVVGKGSFSIIDPKSNEYTNVGGKLRFDGFNDIRLDSVRDIVFSGIGSIQTDGNLTMATGAVEREVADGTAPGGKKTVRDNSRVTAAYRKEAGASFTPADFSVNAAGVATIARSGRVKQLETKANDSVGGSLEIKGSRVDQQGEISVDGGAVSLAATGNGDTDGVFLTNGSLTAARGTDHSSGGTVKLTADNKTVNAAAEAVVDVSAGTQGDAGEMVISAAYGEAALQGELKGNAAGGRGGSLTIDAASVDSSAGIAKATTDGGFDESVDVRLRNQEEFTVAAGETIKARHVLMSVDQGSLTVKGTVDASHAAGGGTVELYAKNNVAVDNGGIVRADAMKADGTAADKGSTIELGSTDGRVVVNNGGTVSVAGGKTVHDTIRQKMDDNGNLQFYDNGKPVMETLREELTGGTVILRSALYDADGNKVTDLKTGKLGVDLNGTVTGAKEIIAYAVGKTSATSSAEWMKTAGYIMENAAAKTKDITDALGEKANIFQFRPEVEVSSATSLTHGTALDLSSQSVGRLTIRSGNDLKIEQKIADARTAMSSLYGATAAPSWDIGLVAGADTTAANPYAVKKGTGNLTVGNTSNKVSAHVYTESGRIRFASGGDTTIQTSTDSKYQRPGYMIDSSMNYTMGTYQGAISGKVGGKLAINPNAAIQSALGSIAVTTGKDLVNSGAIRTAGERPKDIPLNIWTTDEGIPLNNYWKYAGGGPISLRVGGSYDDGAGKPDLRSWDSVNGQTGSGLREWAASYKNTLTEKAIEGVAAMAGGDVTVRTGKRFEGQIGAFGAGDLRVEAGGDLSGRFLLRDGTGTLRTAGNFLPVKNTLTNINEPGYQVIEAFKGDITVDAEGEVVLGAIVNPTLANKNDAFTKWNVTYDQSTSVAVNARHGNASLKGISSYGNNSKPLTGNSQLILPPNLSIEAAGDISIGAQFAMVPSKTGNLRLVAGGSVVGEPATAGDLAGIIVSDADPAVVFPGEEPKYLGSSLDTAKNLYTMLTTSDKPEFHASRPVHEEDTAPVEVRAEGGDIRHLTLMLPKRGVITAEGDIYDLYFKGQNITDDDVTVITSGGNLELPMKRDSDNAKTGIELGGPGALLIRTGGSVDLGTSKGVRTVGNTVNQALDRDGADIVIVAGIDPAIPLNDPGNDATPAQATASAGELQRIEEQSRQDVANAASFLDALKEPSIRISEAIADGDLDEMNRVAEETRAAIINPALDPADPKSADGNPVGGVSLTSSEITTQDNGSIRIIALGDLDVGRTVNADDATSTGITTQFGGTISTYSTGDVNVNESRIMTFFGGDILSWSDFGNLFAGRGSRTIISAAPPRSVPLHNDPDDKTKITGYETVFPAPAAGSGYRSVTYDPDGDSGPQTPPTYGDIYLAAPEGIIDAGEAGVSGGRVFVGAQTVLNAQNIFSVSGQSVGVPSTSSLSIGSLSGSGTMTESGKMFEQASAAAGGKDKGTGGAAEDSNPFATSWLDVKVIGFDTEKQEEERE